ncbi:hypothetical protein HHK36_018046 [Tetracentron sinense]|uniref:Uncharacterized protein n=1 Tax=Tetracentron sinense TaxID=13715 RepID=A0A834Z3X1_TETSI|nr:hypothetical protein HHK36_018046 [Tetracentron sinense]
MQSRLITWQRNRKRESVVSVFESKINHAHTTFMGFLRTSTLFANLTLAIEFQNPMLIIGVIDSGNLSGLASTMKDMKKRMDLLNLRMVLSHDQPVTLKGMAATQPPQRPVRLCQMLASWDVATRHCKGWCPSARLAIYKTLWFDRASDADLLMAFDDAISDGVDIISISIGFSIQRNFLVDPIAIGALHAFRKGILVSASAGNDGSPYTAGNLAPWILTVAASSMDREFNANIYLGNSELLKVTLQSIAIEGFSLSPLKMEKSYGVIDASAAAASGVSSNDASFCENNTLDPALIEGKIVVCKVAASFQRTFVEQAGAVGIIVIGPLATDINFMLTIPSILIGKEEAEELKAYLKTKRYPVAQILSTTTVLNTRPAPKMAEFSSMGPNIITPDIIKPDITAPGVNILAAWSPLATKENYDYNIVSGTSMACPHVSAIAAIIKSCHPSWSPSAIQSAMMTTATVLDNTGRPILKDPNGSPTTPFDYGSGHVNPVAALYPGLIYDFDSNDIIDYLCGTGVRPEQLEPLLGVPVTCKYPPIAAYNLNYPSIGIASLSGNMSVHRTLTYYGKGPTIYIANVEQPEGVKIVVKPHKLNFKNYGEKMSFKVDFIPHNDGSFMFVTGALTWDNGLHKVRSPIALNFV